MQEDPIWNRISRGGRVSVKHCPQDIVFASKCQRKSDNFRRNERGIDTAEFASVDGKKAVRIKILAVHNGIGGVGYGNNSLPSVRSLS